MTTLQIAAFLAAAKNRSFTKAAEELFTTQPTISRQIALLEEELGFPLFNRDKKVPTLTPGGAVMVQGLQHTLNDIDESVAQAKQAMLGLDGDIAMGCLFGTDVERFVHPFTVRFARAHPNIDISMEYGSCSFLRGKLDTGELDIVLTFGFELPSFTQVQHRDYCPLEAFFILAADHPLASLPDLSVRNLMDETYFMLDPKDSHGRSSDLARILEAMGIDGTALKIRYMPNLESILFAVRSGKGFTLSDSSMGHVLDGPYRRIPVTDDEGPSLALVWKKGNENPSLGMLIDYWDSHMDPTTHATSLLAPLSGE